jgi:lipid-A-disaccharide synthase-like uncharacterized protein
VTRIWNRPSGTPDPSDQGERRDSELSMIPNWSVILAVLVFLGAQYLFHFVLPHNRHEMMPMRLLMGYSWGTLFASYVLLVGYVSRDVRRRDMPAGLWMLIVTIMPGGVGAVVYFLLRQPVLMLPALHHRDSLHLPLLPAVPVPDRPRLRPVLPQRQDHRRLLHQLWPRPRRRSSSRPPPRL